MSTFGNALYKREGYYAGHMRTEVMCSAALSLSRWPYKTSHDKPRLTLHRWADQMDVSRMVAAKP